MKIRILATLIIFLASPTLASAATHQFYGDFTLTQYNAAGTGIDKNSVTINPTKGPFEISFFDDTLGSANSDQDFYQIIAQDPSIFTLETVADPIHGGASTYFSGGDNNSSHSLRFSGDDPGTLVFNAFNGVGYDFNPLFSDWAFLVFDVKNAGQNPVEILPRIGPDGLQSNFAMYYVLDENFNTVNVHILEPGDTATYAFKLGSHPDLAGNSIVWDYGSTPTSRFEVGFQPVSGIGFDIRLDNVGLAAVPEPMSYLLFGFGLLIFRNLRKNK